MPKLFKQHGIKQRRKLNHSNVSMKRDWITVINGYNTTAAVTSDYWYTMLTSHYSRNEADKLGSITAYYCGNKGNQVDQNV